MSKTLIEKLCAKIGFTKRCVKSFDICYCVTATRISLPNPSLRCHGQLSQRTHTLHYAPTEASGEAHLLSTHGPCAGLTNKRNYLMQWDGSVHFTPRTALGFYSNRASYFPGLFTHAKTFAGDRCVTLTVSILRTT